jgi:phage terminase large subunit
VSTLVIETPRVYAPLLAPARYKGAHGGRGSGKSHFFAEMLVEDCIREPIDAVCLREIQKSLKFSVKKLIESKIESLNAGDYFDVQNEQIKSRPQGGGSGVIIFQGMQDHTADSIKSLEGFKRAWFEEAQSASQRSLDLLRPTIRTPGSELWFSWNPRFSTDPVDALLRGDTLPPGAIIVQANYSDNPFLPNVLLEEMEYDRSRDPDKYAHIWLGQYQQNSQARVFHNWTVEEFERPSGTIFRLGADWGFASDPSVLIRCDIDGNRLYVDHEAYMVGCEIINLPELFMSVPDAEKWPITADSARPETISHMQKHGFPKIRAAIKGAKSLEEGVEFLKAFDIIVHPRCKHLIDELTLYKYKEDPLTGAVLPVLEDKDNHVIDALRYACEGARRAGTKPKREPKLLRHRPTGAGAWMLVETACFVKCCFE